MGEQSPKGYFREKWWMLGFATFLSAQIINMVSMAMTPQVVLCCLGAWTLVCNALFARIILQERIGGGQARSIVGLVVAMAVVVAHAPHPSDGQAHPTLDQLIARFLSPEFQVLSVVLMGCAAMIRMFSVGSSCISFTKWVATPQTSGGHLDVEAATGDLSSLCLAQRPMAAASWATTAAIAAGYTALLFKCVAELIAGSALAESTGAVDFVPPWYRWEAYVLVAVALCVAPTELHCLNLALQHGDATCVVPTYLALSMLAQLMTGGVFFQEFSDFVSQTQALGFAIGVVLTLVLVVAMARAEVVSDASDAGSSEASTPTSCPASARHVAVEASELKVPLVACAEAPQRSAEHGMKLDMQVPPQRKAVLASKVDLKLLGKKERQELQVSVAGFGGAIECLDKLETAGRGRGRGRQLGGSRRRCSSAGW